MASEREVTYFMSTEGFRVGLARPARFDRTRVTAIATTYKGISFRSRLEAQWAALFDLLKWEWQYEPLDLAGYIPDFIVQFKRAPLLIEVKPCVCYEEFEPYARKIIRSGWRNDFLIVGTHLFYPESANSVRSFGLLGLWDRESQDGWLPAGHAIAIRCRQCKLVAMKHYTDAWFCLSCGACNPRVHFEDAEPSILEELWAETGNRVQWKGQQ